MKKMYEESSINDIATALQTKLGTSDKFKVSEMASAISDIPTGGDYDLEFYQYLSFGTGTACMFIDGDIKTNYSYEFKFNNRVTRVGENRTFLWSTLSDWDKYISLRISAVNWYFGNNDGGYVGPWNGGSWSNIMGSHTVKYDGYNKSTNGDIVFDGSNVLGTFKMINLTYDEKFMFAIGSSSFEGEIEHFKIWNNWNTLIHDYVPAAIKYQGNIIDSGLYDNITDRFYISRGNCTARNTIPT